ncbi:hypothetical protein [Sulfobacillus thermotolerans]|uniref:hypothetical protein n=1 Tax=Sulfobacillus thermotolerans TaxID=338644 RepID=UPI00336730E4
MTTIGWILIALVLFLIWRSMAAKGATNAVPTFLSSVNSTASETSTPDTTGALAANSTVATSTQTGSTSQLTSKPQDPYQKIVTSSQYAYPKKVSNGVATYQASNGATVRIDTVAADGTPVTKVPQFMVDQFAAIDAQEKNTTGSYTGNGTTSTTMPSMGNGSDHLLEEVETGIRNQASSIPSNYTA